MESQVFDRVGKHLLTVFRNFEVRGKQWTPKAEAGLATIITWLKHSKPKLLETAERSSPVLLFTDGACENYLGDDLPTVTIGAVLFAPTLDRPLYFGETVNLQLTAEWRAEGKRQLVTEAEILPILIAKQVWHQHLTNRHVIIFIDSDPARACLIKGSSVSASCDKIVREILFTNMGLNSKDWYARVPTKSNPADAASRLNHDEMSKVFNASRVSISQPTTLKDLIYKPAFEFFQ